MLQFLVATYCIDIIAGDFSYGLLKKGEKLFKDHVQMLNKPTNIYGSLIDHVYIKKSLIEEFLTSATFKTIYFSAHGAVRIIIEKNADDFCSIP